MTTDQDNESRDDYCADCGTPIPLECKELVEQGKLKEPLPGGYNIWIVFINHCPRCSYDELTIAMTISDPNAPVRTESCRKSEISTSRTP